MSHAAALLVGKLARLARLSEQKCLKRRVGWCWKKSECYKLLGTTTIITMQNYLSGLGSWVTIIMGVTFVVCVLSFRRGIVGEIEARLKKDRSR